MVTCPLCGSQLVKEDPLWRCPRCDLRYRVRRGKPGFPLVREVKPQAESTDALRREIERKTGVKFTPEGWEAWLKRRAEIYEQIQKQRRGAG